MPRRESPFRPPVDPGLQTERTALAWRRTTLGLGAATLFVSRMSLDAAGLALAVPLAVGGLAAVVWALLVIGRRTRYARSAEEKGFNLMALDARLPAAMAAVVVLLGITEVVSALTRA